MHNKIYQFSDFTLNTHTRELIFIDKTVPLSSKAFGILNLLIEKRGEVVEKNEILDKVWKETFVEEANLPVHISSLRRALNEKKGENKFIKTVSGKGYCFVADVSDISVSDQKISKENILTKNNSAKTIAILPFSSIPKTVRNEFLENVIPQGIISDLSKFKEIKILSYTSVSKYQDKETDFEEIGFYLNADHILKGYLSNYNDNYLLNIELIDLTDKSVTWSTETIFGLEEFLQIKSALSDQLAKILKLKPRLKSSEHKTISPEAQKLYYRGMFILESRGSSKKLKQTLLQALDYFYEALRIEKNFALAYFGIGSVYVSMHNHHLPDKESAYKKALEASQKAIELDRHLSEAYILRGSILFMFEKDFPKALKCFRDAERSNPNNADAFHWQSLYYLCFGEFEKAYEFETKAVELAPLSLRYNEQLLRIFYYSADFDKAITQAEEILTFDQNSISSKLFMALSYARMGVYESALDILEETIQFSNLKTLHTYKVQALALAKNFDEADKIVNNLISSKFSEEIDQYDFAVMFASIGNKEKAFAALQKSYAEKSSSLCLLKVDPAFTKLQNDDRFSKLLVDLNLL